MLNIIKKLVLCLSLILLINTSHGDESDKFHNLIKNNLDLNEYPYLENRNDIGIFYDFRFNKKKKLLKLKEMKIITL